MTPQLVRPCTWPGLLSAMRENGINHSATLSVPSPLPVLTGQAGVVQSVQDAAAPKATATLEDVAYNRPSLIPQEVVLHRKGMRCSCDVQVCAGRFPLPHRLQQEQSAKDGQAVGGEGVPQSVAPARSRHPLPPAGPPPPACAGHGVCRI